MALTAKEILRHIGQAHRKLEEQRPKLEGILHEIREVEGVTQDNYILLPKGMTGITEYRTAIQRKVEKLAQNVEQAKAFVEEVEAGIPIVADEMLEDLRVLAATQQYEGIKLKIASLLTEISEDIQRVSPKVELIERRFKERVDLTITSPKEGEVVHRGTKYTIQWTCIGPTRDYVKICLLKRGSYLRDIAVQAANLGVGDWLVPAHMYPADDYQIVVRSVSHERYPDYGSGGFSSSTYTRVLYPDANIAALSDTFEIR